jgi:hypothetical protein
VLSPAQAQKQNPEYQMEIHCLEGGGNHNAEMTQVLGEIDGKKVLLLRNKEVREEIWEKENHTTRPWRRVCPSLCGGSVL